MNIEFVGTFAKRKSFSGLRNLNGFFYLRKIVKFNSCYGPINVEVETMHEPGHVPEHLSLSRGPIVLF